MQRYPESTELLRMFFVAFHAVYPYARAIFVVWAVVCATKSLSSIARSLERLVNRWDLDRGAKAKGEDPSSLD